jgi:hypothetical protein
MADEEDDYMSLSILEEAKKVDAAIEKERKTWQPKSIRGKPKPTDGPRPSKKQGMRDTLEKGLATPIDPLNKGFLMLQKMGYK